MSAEVKFIVTANTAQAAAQFESFVNAVNAGMNRVTASSLYASSNAMDVWNAAVARGVGKSNAQMALTAGQIKSTARALSSSLSGMALTGSFFLGAQAQQIIYPLVVLGKELKGLSGTMKLTGLSFGAAGGALSLLAAGAGAGYLVWRNYTSGVREAQKAIDDLKAGIATLPAALQTVTTSLRAGLLSPEAATQYREYLTGKKPLYKSETGEITTSSSELQLRQEQVFNSTGPGARLVEKMVPLQKASMAEVQKWVAEQVTAGKATEDVQKALADLYDLQAKVATDAKDESEKQILEIQRKYQTERDEIQKNMAIAQAAKEFSPAKEKAAEAALELSKQNELAAIAKVRLDKENEAFDLRAKRGAEGFAEEDAYYQRLENRKKQSEQVGDIRGNLRVDLLDGLDAEIAAIDNKYDSEIEKVKELNLSYEEELDLLEEIADARFKKKGDATAADAKKQSQDRLTIRQQEEDAVVSILSSGVQAAKMFGKEGFIAWQSMALGEAIIATSLAITRALGEGGPYAGPFMAAAAGAAGAVQIAAIASATPGYYKGGYTGTGRDSDVAGIVHRNEFVVPASAVARIGVSNLEGMTAAAVRGPAFDRRTHSSSGESKESNIQIHFWDDGSAMKKKIESDRDVQHVIVDVVRRQSRIITGRP